MADTAGPAGPRPSAVAGRDSPAEPRRAEDDRGNALYDVYDASLAAATEASEIEASTEADTDDFRASLYDSGGPVLPR